MNCCFLFFLFLKTLVIGCPSPNQRIRDMELLSVVHPVPKQKALCPLIDVYYNVYLHGYQMFHLFSSHYHSNNDSEPNIAQEIRPLMPCFPRTHITALVTDIRHWPRISLNILCCDCQFFFPCSISHSCVSLISAYRSWALIPLSEAPANRCM